MNPEQISLIKRSWQQIAPSGETAATLFYDRLFELDPALRPLFRGDLDAQGRKLVAMLNHVVTHLDSLPAVLPEVQALGRRHHDYGVQPQHYETVATALLWTLGAGLGPGFTVPVREAWTQAYGLLADAMLQAATAPASTA